jgi:hypothetical protein
MGRNEPGGTGTINFKHWLQNIYSDKFQTKGFDGQKPVDYPVENFKTYLKDTPIMNFYGSVDAFSQPKDYARLHALLPNVTAYEVEDYNHLDYLWSKDVDVNVNIHMIPFIK